MWPDWWLAWLKLHVRAKTTSLGTWSLLFIYLQSSFPFQAVKLATATYTSCTPSCILFLIYWCIKKNALYCRVSHIRGKSNCLTIISITPHAAADKPPFNVSVEATPFSVSIEWVESPDNLPVVTGYIITMVNVVTEAVTTVYIEGSSRKEEVSGLTPFTEYSFTVTAKYKYGAGPPSETLTRGTKEHGKLKYKPPAVRIINYKSCKVVDCIIIALLGVVLFYNHLQEVHIRILRKYTRSNIYVILCKFCIYRQ